MIPEPYLDPTFNPPSAASAPSLPSVDTRPALCAETPPARPLAFLHLRRWAPVTGLCFVALGLVILTCVFCFWNAFQPRDTELETLFASTASLVQRLETLLYGAAWLLSGFALVILGLLDDLRSRQRHPPV